MSFSTKEIQSIYSRIFIHFYLMCTLTTTGMWINKLNTFLHHYVCVYSSHPYCLLQIWAAVSLWHFSCYSLQHRIMSQRSALPRACVFFRKCFAGSTEWPVLSKQIASEQRGVRELGLPEKNKVLSPINHSLCSGRCLPNEVEIIGGCCRCPYFTDTEHCLFKRLKWSDSTHLSDFFISKPEHQWPRGLQD